MKYFVFKNEKSLFDDILKDPNVKKKIQLKIGWKQHLMLAFNDDEDKLFSYLMLKYGDDMTNLEIKDFSPIPGVDYKPDRTKYTHEN